jgi:uncharacterized protein (TIGR03435 family)
MRIKARRSELVIAHNAAGGERIDLPRRAPRAVRSSELLALGMFGRGSRLGGRIEMLLEHGRDFSPRASGTPLAVGALGLLGCVIAVALAPRVIAFAQTPSFEVASIKAGDADARGSSFGTDSDKLTMRNVTLKDCIQWAYGLKDYQVSGPNWIESQRYVILAKAPAVVPEPQIKVMLQGLLADRFKLTVHRETKERAVYQIVVAKNGPKLDADASPGAFPRFTLNGAGHLRGQTASITGLAEQLSKWLDKPVLDRSGLSQTYDFKLTWIPGDGERLRGAAGDTDGPSIFAAMEEQLGLRLEAAKGPVEFLVIDHVEKPDAN